jgi:alkanesulfonate monooxygenase SsuD/methylene tetrahydromethanopterin reductase-like flavin-dependent oxidoreductase (luciferase family)
MNTRKRLEFGVSVEPTTTDPARVRNLAEMADRLDLDLVGIQDHPYNSHFFDTWTLIATLVPVTKRVRFFPDVANLPLRPPAMLAKAAATLDVISGGRIELGLGAGAFWDGVRSMGGPVRRPGEAVKAVEEAITIIRALWGTRPASFEGTSYSIHGVHPGPQPAHPIGIWVGALGPRMLDLIGRLADGWVPSLPYLPPAQVPAAQRQIDEAALRAGRKPEEIRRIYNVMGQIMPTQRGYLHGPVLHWVEELTRFAVDLRLDAFIFWPAGEQERQFEVFAREVAPAVRKAVARG